MIPDAPPRLSITTGCPSCSFSLIATARARTSVGPPAGKGTIMRIVLFGYSCPALVERVDCAETLPLRSERQMPAAAIATLFMLNPRLCRRMRDDGLELRCGFHELLDVRTRSLESMHPH